MIGLFLLAAVCTAWAGGYCFARRRFDATLFCAALCAINMVFVRLEALQ